MKFRFNFIGLNIAHLHHSRNEISFLFLNIRTCILSKQTDLLRALKEEYVETLVLCYYMWMLLMVLSKYLFILQIQGYHESGIL